MSRPYTVLGEIVDEIRTWRRGGERVSQIMRRLADQDMQLTEIAAYLNEAFCFGMDAPPLQLLRRDENGWPLAEKVDLVYDPAIEQARERWMNAPPYPDMLRRRDRHVFRALAIEKQLIIVVHLPPPAARTHVGKPGFRPCPANLFGVTRASAPNEGLIAADPADERLARLFGPGGLALNYDAYAARLDALGYQIAPASEGHIVRNAAGEAFYPGYYLHGVYRGDTRTNAYKGKEGEQLRYELNSRLGDEFVQWGPHDNWDIRDDNMIAPMRAPQPPVIFFLPDGGMENRFDADSIEGYYTYLELDWLGLYPPIPAAAQENQA